jgi:hypothetical protein
MKDSNYFFYAKIGYIISMCLLAIFAILKVAKIF